MSRQGEGPAKGADARAEGEVDLSATFRIVGIGASAGGLHAVSDLLRALPGDLEMAFVVVMHLDPSQPSSLAQLLDGVCAMPVEQASDGVEMEPGHVYVIPPKFMMSAHGSGLRLVPRPASSRPPGPIDHFLCSLATDYDGRGIGVVLSGTGSDGTVGIRALKAGGGIVFAQDESADYGDMPANAVATGCVDGVLPPASIAAELVDIGRHPTRWLHEGPIEAGDHREDGAAEKALDGLVLRLSRATGIDFDNYKQTTVRRRIQRRILLLGLEGVDEYVTFFEEHSEESERLCQDILIRVTGFFRDPDVFERLGELVLPAIAKDRTAEDPIRVWVPGCATGEEVYSIAIALLEYLSKGAQAIPIKLFGTDVSEEAITVARAGRFPRSLSAELTPERLRNYFVREEGAFVVTQAVRDLCVFARQDATRDPPFSNLDLISCRNLLIYLGPALQKRVMPMFHYALREGGYLLLGKAESVSDREGLFEAVDGNQSIYVRKSVPRRLPADLGLRRSTGRKPGPPGHLATTVSRFDVQREADRILLGKYAPAGVLIDDNLEVIQFRGNTGNFLAPAPGPPSNKLLGMCREGLLPDLSAVIEQGQEHGLAVRREGLRIVADGCEVHASLELFPIRVPGSAERYYVVVFEEAATGRDHGPRPSANPSPPAGDLESMRIEQLERELHATRDYLRANVERLEAANEALRAANEEVLSSNEELHSTNEELQTAKEELQSSNEELLTTNEELLHRNKEVALLSDDLSNLLASVKIPIVMLGRDLRLRRFTPSAARIFGISDSAIGRDLPGPELDIGTMELRELLLEVLDSLVVVEREVRRADGHWYSLRVCPYRTENDKVDGVVITLADIDALKRLTQGLEQARDFAEAVVMSVRDPILVIDDELAIKASNRAFHEAFATTPDAIANRHVGTVGSWTTPGLLERLTEVLVGREGFTGLEEEVEVPGRGMRHLRLSARTVPARGGDGGLVLLTLEDVTELDEEQARKDRLTEKLREGQRLESLGVLAGGIAHDFNNILTAILGFAELTQLELAPNSPECTNVERIVESAQRAAELCNEMLAYSGRGRFQVRATDLSEVVEQSTALLEAMISKGVTLYYTLANGLPAVQADVAQLRQVLANLVINASEANDQGGELRITTGVMHAEQDYLDQTTCADLPAGDYEYLEVADDGHGMSPETQARIFDPFFTTKSTGRGLGLSAVLGIAHGHGGTLALESDPGAGTTFRLLLPIQKGDVPSDVTPSEPDDLSWQGAGVILVVDDEAEVRVFLRSMLPRLGFEVREASNGEEGLELLRTSSDSIALVLLDLTMPVLSGKEALPQMRASHPGVPVILMSGYDEEEAVRSIPGSDIAGFLRKPFLRKDLSAALREALAAAGT